MPNIEQAAYHTEWYLNDTVKLPEKYSHMSYEERDNDSHNVLFGIKPQL